MALPFIYRNSKGTPLTFTEGDNNLSVINTRLVATVVSDVNSPTSQSIRFLNGAGSVLETVEIEHGNVKSVNGTTPDANGNVATTLTDVQVGLSGSIPSSASNGTVYVVAGETVNTGSNGESFIYSTDANQWYKLAPLDQVANDARYVLKSGDTLTGPLKSANPSNPTENFELISKQYADKFIYTASLSTTSSTTSTVTFTRGNSSSFDVEIPGGGAKTFVGSAPPFPVSEGNLWLDDTTTGELFVYDGTQWVSVSGISGADVTTNGNTFEGDQVITGSVSITEVLNLAPVTSLPTGKLGDVVTSGSSLYFHNGTAFKEINLNP